MVQTAHDYKYTDRDVREDPRLTELAEAYLRSYGGEFEPLIEAKTYLRVVGPMPTTMVRRVLNCMRHDNKVAGQMPVPQRSFDMEDIGFGTFGPQAHVPEPVVEEPKRRVFSYTIKPIAIKMDFIAATAKSATAYHLVDKEMSNLRYYTAGTGEFRDNFRTMCGQHLATGVLLAAAPEGRKQCRMCYVQMDERERRRAEREAEATRMREERARG